MKKFINEKTVSDLRSDITKLGYSEKSGELSSGGGLQSDFVDILSYLLNEWKKQNGESCKLTFTAGNDFFHKNRKSRHTNGEAVDVVLGPECRSKFIQILERYKSIYNGFAYIDEYTNPSKGATGGHFHLSYRQGQPEGGGKNKEDGDEDDVKTPVKSDSTSGSTSGTTSGSGSGGSSSGTTSGGADFDIYGGLLNKVDGNGVLKKVGNDIWDKTMGKVQKALGESTNNDSNKLNEEVKRIKKMMNL